MNFRYKLMQFMSGRYGMDEMNYTIIFTAIALSIANIFLRIFRLYYICYIFQVIVYALIFYAFLRALSRNIEARRKENTWFKAKANRIRKKREIYNQRKADIFHVYKKCPACKAVLRLPHRIGVHKTICPRCSKEFTVKVKK